MPHRNNSLPIDGRGGSLWQNRFSVPVYYPDGTDASETSIGLTWDVLEDTTAYIARQNVVYAISFGLVLMTAIHVMALTPSTKRGLPFYTFTFLTINCELLRLLSEIILWSRTGFGSFYYQLIGDATNVQFVGGTIALLILGQIASTLAFLFVQLCFFIQAKAVLGALKVTRPQLHATIFIYLIGFGAFTLAWRLMFTVWGAVNDAGIGTRYPLWIWRLCDVFYAISIGSWSFIFSVQVAFILYRRARLGGTLKRTETLNILLLTGLESMLLPLTACVLALATDSWLPEPEILIMVSVVVILPFGSLWAGSMQTYDKRNHTFTRSAADDNHNQRPLAAPASNDSTAPSNSQALRSGAFKHAHSPRSSSLPTHHMASPSRRNSGCSVDNAPPRCSGSHASTMSKNPSRPMGILEQDLYDDDDEVQSPSFRHEYTVSVDAITHAPPRFPAEHI